MSNQTNTQDRIPALKKQLKLLLEKDLSDLSALQATLNQETEALKTRESSAISDLAKTKDTLVKQIQERARAKVKLITNSGADIRPGQVGKGIDQLGDPDLSALWQTSLEQLEICKERNQVNGLVIERSRMRNQKIIDIVRGQNKKPKLYGKQGGEQAYSGTNRIAKA